MAIILVVDDDSQAIELTARLITQVGHTADFLLESHFLLQKLEASPPDLLLLDVNMPDIDGLTLLRRLKSTPKLCEIPVIMITGESEESLIQECFQLGAVDFIHKPIRSMELLSRIRIALEAAAHLNAIHAQKNALQQAKTLTDAILNSMEDAICVIDSHTRTILEANRVFLTNINQNREAIIGQHCIELLGKKCQPCLHCTSFNPETCLLQETKNSGVANCQEISYTNSQKKTKHIKLYTFPIHNSAGLTDRIVYLERDVTKPRELEKRLKHLAFHDPLTKLPNRQLFDDRLRQALAQGRRHQQIVAVMLLDLDHFKTINDTLGHASGDLLLKEVAIRLNSCIRESDTAARMGGDEFTAVLTNITNELQIKNVARKILKSLRRKFKLTNKTIRITSSIGIALYPQDGKEMSELLNRADKALYRAKSKGRNNAQFFTPTRRKK